MKYYDPNQIDFNAHYRIITEAKERRKNEMKEERPKEIALRPSYWASVSGGKDSLYMLNLILHNLDKYPLTGVVHFELEIDYPFIHDVIAEMKRECEKYNIPFYSIKPETSWYDWYDRKGMPTRKTRWCLEWKLTAKRQHDEFMKSNGYDTIYYIGYCADEINRYEKRNNNRERYPLVEEGINESVILEWAQEQPIFNEYYRYNKRCGCMFCPMSSVQNLAYLYKFYPREYDHLIQMCRDTEELRSRELGRPFSIWQSNPKYNTDWYDHRIRTKYALKVEQ